MKKPTARSFYWFGFACGMSVTGASLAIIQDWLGLDAYITFVRRTWVNVPWWIWLFDFAFIACVYRIARRTFMK